jgi:4-amino-4-deoxy-L-arabinose transferase-like glycosyltransferase
MLGLIVILGLAALLRLGWPGIHSFGYDEARISLLALQMARGGQFASVGMVSSVGFPNPPGFVWLMALPYALSRDPLAASLLIGALNVLAVWGVWGLARRAWGPWAALAAGLLMASSPFAVFYSRSIWSQDLLAPLAVLWALAGVRGVRRESGPLLALHLFLAGFAWQVHYAGLVLLPASAWLLLRYRLWKRWPWLLAGGGAALLAIAPFAYTLLRKAPDALASLGTLSAGSGHSGWDAVLRWAEVGLGANWDWLPLGGAWRWQTALAWAQRIAQGITGALIAVGLAGLVRQCWRTRRAPQGEAEILAALLPAWALAPPLVFILSSTTAHHQYQLAALPALLLAGAATATFLPERWRWRGSLVAALALAVALPQGLSAARSIEANSAALQPGGLGTPLAYPRAASVLLRDGAPVYVHAASDDPAYDADAAGMSVLLWEYPHRLVNGSAALLLPPEGETAHLFFPFPDLPALEQAHHYADIQATLELPRRQGEPPYVALRVTGGAPQGLRSVAPVALANGATLRGWKARWEGKSLMLVTWWQIGEELEPGRYHQFNHLYAADGEAPAQVRDMAISSPSWQVGDTLITWASFAPQEPGPYRFEVGMYAYPELVRVPIAEMGHKDAATISLGPVE